MAAKRRIEEEEPVGVNRWMVTFSDLVMLLLTFFVLLLTMSSMDSKRVKEVFKQFRGATGVLELSGADEIANLEGFISSYRDPDNLIVVDQDLIRRLFIPTKESNRKLAEVLKNAHEMIDITEDQRGLILSFQGDLLFDSGQVALRKESYPILDAMAIAIANCDNEILIVGHTDDIPAGRRFGSNWDLSLYRGLSVLDYFLLEKHLSPLRFSVGGCGDSRPLHPNDGPEGRALNRRVEIIFRHM